MMQGPNAIAGSGAAAGAPAAANPIAMLPFNMGQMGFPVMPAAMQSPQENGRKQ